MFSENFKNDAKFNVTNHHSIHFETGLGKETLLKALLGPGSIQKFVTPDTKTSYAVNYNDKRILGSYSTAVFSQCCAFTKTNNRWYLFPISKNELKNVSMTEDTLVYWLKFLNEMGIGLNYYYLGKQEVTLPNLHANNSDSIQRQALTDNNYYWVAIGPTEDGKNNPNVNITYLHWVLLRYCFNTQTSGQYSSPLGLNPGVERLSYYVIPRITDYFHRKLGLPKLKALLYAHIASVFYSAYGLSFTDYMGVKIPSSITDPIDLKAYPAPCVNITEEQFKTLLFQNTYNIQLNQLLTTTNFDYITGKGTFTQKAPNTVVPKELKNLDAPYAKDYETLHANYKLFNEGKYQEFVDAIDSAYDIKPSKKSEGTILKKRLINTKLKKYGRELAYLKSNTRSGHRSISSRS